MVRFICVIFWLMAIPALAIAQSETPMQSGTPILVDQFGYLPELEKIAVIKDPKKGYDAGQSYRPGQRFAVISVKTGEVVYEGRPELWQDGQVDAASGDRLWWFDFSDFTDVGRYKVKDLDNGTESYEFEISSDIYKPVLKAAFKTFYYQRAGFEKRAEFVGKAYADKASHLRRGQDSQARLFSTPKDASTVRDLRGGWYDAGDYNQYTSWTANYIRSLLASYIENPAAWTDDFDIAESGNGIPDILDEVKWGLDWLERMQNDDGSMLSILGRDDGSSPPSKSKGPSYYGPANASATMVSAGSFAMAAKVFADHPALTSHSERYKQRALKAWDWAQNNKTVRFYNNDDRDNSIGLGAGQQEVEDDRLAKMRLISSIHLFALTGDKVFADCVRKIYAEIKPLSPTTPNGFEGDMAFDLLYYAKLPNVRSKFAQKIQDDYAAQILDAYNAWPAVEGGEDGYRAFVDGYWWGSNSTKARRGSVYMQAVLAEIMPQKNKDYLNAAKDYLHYLHGVNPNGKVYLSNMAAYGAENSVNSFYHLWFKDGSKLYDDVRTSRYGPAPGFLVGGPNEGYERAECCATGTCGGYGDKICLTPIATPPANQPPAKSYTDFNDGWPNNSWSVTENSNSYQSSYIRLLSKFVR